MLDGCNRLSVVVYWSTMWSRGGSGKFGFTDFFSQVVAIVMRKDELEGDIFSVT